MKVFLAGENGKNKIIPAIRGGQQQINAYLGVKSENFWRGGNQGTGYIMTWFRL